MKRPECIEKTSLWRCIQPYGLLFLLSFSVCSLACGNAHDDTVVDYDLTEDNGPPCPTADWMHLPVLNVGTSQEVSAPEGIRVRTAIVPGLHDMLPAQFTETRSLQFNEVGLNTVFAITDGTTCSSTVIRRVVEVVYAFPTSDGVDKADPKIQAWASSWAMPVSYGESVVELWQTPELAMGPASGQPTDIVSLGEGGQIEVFFDGEIYDGEGPDFVVFENSFSPTFLEIGIVEVSSDGIHFAQFPVLYLGTEAIDAYGDHPPEIMYGFAGRYPAGVGTPFNLQDLRFDPDVENGLVDLDRITSVRITDVIGDGSRMDNMGRPIFDPFPTTGSAGFDLDAVGVIHLNETQEPPATEASR